MCDLTQYAVPRLHECAAHARADLCLCCVSKDDGDAICRSGNLLGVCRAVAQECGLFPHAAEEEPRETECGEKGEVGTRRLCLCNLSAHCCSVPIGTTGDDFHGDECNFHSDAPFQTR